VSTSSTAKPLRRLGAAGGVPEGAVIPYYLAYLKHRVSVARVDGRLYAFDDLCPHEPCPLSSGLLTGTTIMCQCHGCRFDITTGAVLNGPATTSLGVYDVVEADGGISASV
jgi:3-phenylpropionate/trans-cinnamate dioxygenase ferredoxin component